MTFLQSYHPRGGGISSIVLPSLIASGYKDFNGHGKQNRTSTNAQSQEWKNSSSVTLDNTNKKRIDDNAAKKAKDYGISVGRIPWKNKIGGKLESKCKNGSGGSSSTAVTLGHDKWNVGITNWKSNQNLFGEVSFTCQNKTGTLYLKWEGGSSVKKGWYGRVILPK
ncbi:hypothetical protein [Candidatus Mycoplasma haematominutum]|uniref:Uncharacterized protein n=1 Tax=Candidatus Mycoplasma haematominutum 'Birmingham 1' TaxID=1116213 RepID=G8C2Q4_9MOLU|nr:hypothetical protein [Candidatus Mycoplasma haematominutum]CCE66602.1 hypothetical protein MHM_00840 [Candidatus Mycoplasma haematominutum 'Birmingham 1']